MSLNRRQFVAGAGTALGIVGLGTTVLANETASVEIVEVNPTEETVVLENTGDEAVDLEGYQIDWEHEDDQDQADEIDDSLTLKPGEQLSIWSGFQSTQIDDVQADYRIADYDQGRINDDDPDVIALLSPDGEVVATSDDDPSSGDNSSDDDSDSNNDTDENDGDTGGDSEADEDGDDTDSDTDEDGDDGESTDDSDDDDADEETEEPTEEDCPEGEETEAETEAEDAED